MSNKLQPSAIESLIRKVSSHLLQWKAMPSKIYNYAKQILLLVEGHLSQHSEPIPIKIRIEPAVVERIEVKRRS